jgi:hypothetical protein
MKSISIKPMMNMHKHKHMHQKKMGMGEKCKYGQHMKKMGIPNPKL